MDQNTLHGACHCQSVTWQYTSMPKTITACNCTVCSRYGVLWAYGYLNSTVYTSGTTKVYERGDHEIEFHFCSKCGCVAYWLAKSANDKKQLRIAVNMRLITEPGLIEPVSIRHFEGLHTFSDLDLDPKTVKDLWF